MLDFTSSFLRSLRRPVFFYLATLAISVQVVFAFLFYQAEVGHNPAVDSYFDSLYYTVNVMTSVGLGDIHPITFLGRVVSMLMMLSSTVIFVCFTGVLAASILEIEAVHVRVQKPKSERSKDP
jgi:voltage-gated potassium channel